MANELNDSIASETAAREVTVPLDGRSYRIVIQPKSDLSPAAIAAEIRTEISDLTHALVIADEAVVSKWSDPLADQLRQSTADSSETVRVSVATVPSGEPSKSVSRLEELWRWMADERADRRSVVVAVGGGVVGDLAGFAAATYTRGIRFVQVPTTLLAMVDSSVGGKTGINLPTAKNMVGAFWQPALVVIDPAVLSTLPERSYRSGLAEVVKYGVIDDDAFFGWLERNANALVEMGDDAVAYAIQKSCESKARVVGEDERESSGRRAILNYGHTFAHAIEATSGYGVLMHGEAVSIGMQMAANLAIRLGMCDADLLPRQTSLLKACGLPTTLAAADPDQMLPAMMRDKKVAHGKLRFVLPTKIGEVVLAGDIDPSAVRSAIEACRS